jgi:hypothetical protein
VTACDKVEISIFSFSSEIVCILIPVDGVSRIGISERLHPEEKRFFTVLMRAYHELGYQSMVYTRGDTVCPKVLQLASKILNESVGAYEIQLNGAG